MRRPIRATLGLLAALLLLPACTTTGIYRNNFDVLRQELKCTPDEDGKLAAPVACASAFAEVADGESQKDPFRYTLFFTEFDDQGWAMGDNGKVQMELVLAELRKRLDKETRPKRSECVKGDTLRTNLVVYVHGWKHNAHVDDSNVRNFRKVLREIGIAECQRTQRDVVGIYVGWRGASLDLGEPLNSASFWDRKNVAADVAQGAVRELFARLDAMVDKANTRWARNTTKPVRMLVIGHSFGGHVLLTGLGGSVLKNLAQFDEDLEADGRQGCSDPKNRLDRDGDMIVLVNPAIEGTRFEPLYALGRKWQDKCYRAPLFVSVTSMADVATAKAFPAGRWVSTWLEKHPAGEEQKRADLWTFGHHERYLTHDLTLQAPGTGAIEACRQWSTANLACSIDAEFENEQAFAARVQAAWDPSLPRSFCAGAQLTPLEANRQWLAPVLNIRTTGDLIADHNAIYKPEFVSFLRELYMDTLIKDFEARRTVARKSDRCPPAAVK